MRVGVECHLDQLEKGEYCSVNVGALASFWQAWKSLAASLTKLRRMGLESPQHLSTHRPVQNEVTLVGDVEHRRGGGDMSRELQKPSRELARKQTSHNNIDNNKTNTLYQHIPHDRYLTQKATPRARA